MLERIKYIKFLRTKPEVIYAYNIITNLEEYYHLNFSDIIFYKYQEKLLFDYNSKTNVLSYYGSDIWDKLAREYHFSHYDLVNFIKDMVEKYLTEKEVIFKCRNSGFFSFSVSIDLIKKI